MEERAIVAAVSGVVDLYLSGVFALAGLYLSGAETVDEALAAIARAVSWPGWLPSSAVRVAAGSVKHLACRIRRRR